MPRVLFISVAIPPFAESHTIRNVFLLRGLHDAGIQSVVIAPASESGDSSLASRLPPLDIHRTGAPPFDRLISRVQGFPGAARVRWGLGVWSNFFAIPDSRFGWDRMVVDYVREHAAAVGPFDAVVASSSSYTAQMAAARIAKERGVPYIADLGDPWTLNPIWPATFPYRVLRNRAIERRVIPTARLVTVTTQETVELYQKWLGPKCPPMAVVPMGFAPEEFRDVPAPDVSREPRLTYVGVAYKTGRNLLPVFEAVARVQRDEPLGFEIAGPYSKSFETYAREKGMRGVRFHGRVPYDRSLEIIRSAEILVVIGNPGSAQVPGKVFMYLAAGRPILLVAQNSESTDPSWRTLKGFAGTYFCPHDADRIEATLRRILADRKNVAREAFARVADPELRRFEWGEIGRRFGGMVREQLSGRG